MLYRTYYATVAVLPGILCLPRIAMMLVKEYQLNESEHSRKKQMLTSLTVSTNRLQDTNPSRAILITPGDVEQ